MTKKRTRRTYSAQFKARIALLALRRRPDGGRDRRAQPGASEPGDAVEDAVGRAGTRRPSTPARWVRTSTPVVKELHAKIGQLSMEIDFLSGALGKAGMLSAKR